MRPLERAISRRRDPAPPRWKYRLERIRLSRAWRVLCRRAMPVAALMVLVAVVAADERSRRWVSASGALAWQQISSLMQLRWQKGEVALVGASPVTQPLIQAALPADLPRMLWGLDLYAIRDATLKVGAVEDAWVRWRPDGVLELEVREREPAWVWHSPDGVLLLDTWGTSIGRVARADTASELPIILGAGADRAVSEISLLMKAAGPLAARVQSFGRIGERRWDMQVRNGPRILLPESDAEEALARLTVLDQTHRVTMRNLEAIDLRIPFRTTLVVGAPASDLPDGNVVMAGGARG